MDIFTNINHISNTDSCPNQNTFSMHMHSNYEIFCFLGGDAKYIVEGTSYPLHKGDFVLMRPSESHHICILSPKEYTRIAINFSPINFADVLTSHLMQPFHDRPLGKFNHYPSAHFSANHLLHYINKICQTDAVQIKSAYLTAFLNELNPLYEKLKTSDITSEPNTLSYIIQYINENLTEDLSLSHISEKFFISKSQINRNFKKYIGSTLWDYIINKRLLLAKRQIDEFGRAPTKVYLDCGFKDYTVFYRAYRKKFGISPSTQLPETDTELF